MTDKVTVLNKIKTLQEEIIIVKEDTLGGQKRLKEIEVELYKLNKELFDLLYKDIAHVGYF